MKLIEEEKLRLPILGLGIFIILVLPLLIMRTGTEIVGAGFIEDYLSILAYLFLAPFIISMSILIWEFDMIVISFWYIIIFWTLPPIAIGVALVEDEQPGDIKGDRRGYEEGYLIMLFGTIIVLILGIIGVVVFGFY